MSSMDNVALLPVSKRNMSPAEFLDEMAILARKHPERFKRLMVISVEETPRVKTRLNCLGMTTIEGFGVLKLGEIRLNQITSG